MEIHVHPLPHMHRASVKRLPIMKVHSMLLYADRTPTGHRSHVQSTVRPVAPPLDLHDRGTDSSVMNMSMLHHDAPDGPGHHHLIDNGRLLHRLVARHQAGVLPHLGAEVSHTVLLRDASGC